MSTQQIVFIILAFVVSFICAFAATPIAKRIAFKIGAVDVPKDSRRMHKKPMARLGGLAIVFGFGMSILCLKLLSVFQPQLWLSVYAEKFMTRELTATLCGACLIVLLGIFDDCMDLNAKLKFLVQIAAAVIVVVGGNLRIDVLTNPNFFSSNPYWVLPNWLSIAGTIIWIVFFTNAVNFIDGLDGLAVGVSAIMAVSLVFISLRVGEYSIALVGIALMGSCFGFLPYNFNPAKIFMGDTGSTFLGFMLATLSIQGMFKSYALISFAVPILILGLPLFDATFAMLRRMLTGKSPMTADRGHLHHRLIDMGFSQKQTVFILYAISGVLGITAVVMAESGALRALLLLICILISIMIGGMLGSKTNDTENQDHYDTSNDDEIKTREKEEENHE